MAFSGAHIAFGYISAPPNAANLGAVVWSQTMANPGTTTQAAGGVSQSLPGPTGSNMVFEIRSAADIFVAIGPNPDAVNGPRVLVIAGERRNLFCAQGDKLAWTTA